MEVDPESVAIKVGAGIFPLGEGAGVEPLLRAVVQ